MLNEFDQWLEAKYLSRKARKDRWYWNDSIERQRRIALCENRQWLPAVAYCRYADDFVIIVKGNKAHAEAIREVCRAFLEGALRLTLNMDKTLLIQIQRRPKPLAQRDGPGVGVLAGKPSLLDRVRGNRTVDDTEHPAHEPRGDGARNEARPSQD